jgi:hypothetical protein
MMVIPALLAAVVAVANALLTMAVYTGGYTIMVA